MITGMPIATERHGHFRTKVLFLQASALGLPWDPISGISDAQLAVCFADSPSGEFQQRLDAWESFCLQGERKLCSEEVDFHGFTLQGQFRSFISTFLGQSIWEWGPLAA